MTVPAQNPFEAPGAEPPPLVAASASTERGVLRVLRDGALLLLAHPVATLVHMALVGAGAWVVSLSGISVLEIFSGVLMSSWVTYFWAAQARGESVDFATWLGVGAARLVPTVATAVLSLLAMALGLTLLIVPGILWFIQLAFSSEVVVLEGRGPIDAMRRSRALVRGRWWRAAAIAALPSTPSTVLAIGVAVVQGAESSPLWLRPITAITAVYGLATWLVFYLDVCERPVAGPETAT